MNFQGKTALSIYKRRFKLLVERKLLKEDMKAYPRESFSYQRKNLEAAAIELKIEILSALFERLGRRREIKRLRRIAKQLKELDSCIKKRAKESCKR